VNRKNTKTIGKRIGKLSKNHFTSSSVKD